MRMTLAFFLMSLVVTSCKPTYQKETLKESVKNLAKKEYKLDVEVETVGKTLGVRFAVRNLLSELLAEDQLIWNQLNDLMLVLSRVSLSVDESPTYVVLYMVDADNPSLGFIFTRHVLDLRKIWAEALSQTAFHDRLSIEFLNGRKKIPFDFADIDMVRLMMIAMDETEEDASEDTVFKLSDIKQEDFLSHVAANSTRRLFREKKALKENCVLREALGRFERNTFMMFLDLITQPGVKLPPKFIEADILPVVAKEVSEMFQSYKVKEVASIIVMEKNTGKMAVLGR